MPLKSSPRFYISPTCFYENSLDQMSFMPQASIAAFPSVKQYKLVKEESMSLALATCCTAIVFIVQYGKAFAAYL